jgi:hypothetical protein
MGAFHTGCRVENHVERSKGIKIPRLLVDTGREYTWAPEASLEKIGVTREKKDLQQEIEDEDEGRGRLRWWVGLQPMSFFGNRGFLSRIVVDAVDNTGTS